MTQNVPLDYKDPVHEGFFDAIQEMLGAATPNFRVVKKNSTTLEVVAGTENEQVSLAIQGRYRWRTSATTASIGALPDGEHPVFVTASDNDFTGPAGDIDEKTVYTFGLEIKEAAHTPATALYREVGKVTVASGAITAFRQTVSSVSGAQIENGALSSAGDITWARDSSGAWVPTLVASIKGGTVPTATILATARATAASGFVLCEGQAVSRSSETYLALFEAIGTTYGVGNGTTTFNVPDLRGRVPVGVDGAAARLSGKDALGEAAGDEKLQSHKHGPGTLKTGTESASHHHAGVLNLNWKVDIDVINGNTWGGTSGTSGDESAEHTHTVTSGESASAGTGGGENLPPYQIVNYMIKL